MTRAGPAPPRDLRDLFWRRGLPLVGAVIVVVQLVAWLPNHVHTEGPYDVDIYHAAARHRAAGEQVYGRQTRTRTDSVTADFFYPPTALAILAPASRLGDTGFRYAGFGLAIVSVWLLAAALFRMATGAVDLGGTLAVGALLTIYPPVALNLTVGNADLAVIAMTAWAFAAPARAAPLLVLAASIKVYPAFALVAWLPRADRRFRLQAAATAAALALATLAVVDFRYVREWLTLGLSSLSNPTVHYGNWSLSMMLIYPDLHAEIASTPVFSRIVLMVSPIVAAVVTAVALRRRPVQVAALATLVAGTWFTALCWWWRILVLLTLPAAAWVRSRRPDGRQAA